MRSHRKGRRARQSDGVGLSDGDAAGRPGVPGRHGVDVAGRRHVPGARRISDALGVPMDVALNMPRMSFEGNARLVLDNHRG